MILYRGSKEIVRFPEVRKATFNKDFYFGFYCTIYKEQAERWATRYGKKGYINSYDYIPNPALKYNHNCLYIPVMIIFPILH